MGKAYRYNRLAQGQVRFVELYSDICDAPLRCRIFVRHLRNAPPFEALSYVWGPQQPLYDLECTGDSEGLLALGPNLYHALLSLRFLPFDKPTSRYLWIDRVCINQDDTRERASQVALMGSIYRECWQALVWLGRDDPMTSPAFDCAAYIHKDNIEQRETTLETLAKFKHLLASPTMLVDCLKYLANLTYWPWVERAWTFQEVILPSQVLLVCGERSMPLEFLESCSKTAVEQTSSFYSPGSQLIFATRRVAEDFGAGTRQLPDDDFERILTFRRETKMLDPRDYIYSLLGLFSPSIRNSLPPDYTISVKQLFTRATKVEIHVSGSLRVLCSVESPKCLRHEALPSWVPDWRATPESIKNTYHDRNPRSGYRATMNASYQCQSTLDSDKLEVHGIAIGVINQAGKSDDFHTISAYGLGKRYHHTNQSITTALRQAQTLSFDIDVALSDNIHSEHPQRRSLAAFYDLPEYDFTRQECDQCPDAHPMPIISLEEVSRSPELFTIARLCVENTSSRAFFTTDTNHIGFGPECTASGDQIYLLLGSDLPFILRPDGKNFKLVGACYVHGIMYGEGLHHGIMINPHFYPGSIPGIIWDLSSGCSTPPTGTWKFEPEDDPESKRGGTRKFWLCEEEREPLLIAARTIILE